MSEQKWGTTGSLSTETTDRSGPSAVALDPAATEA